jgi:hypothetical protein
MSAVIDSKTGKMYDFKGGKLGDGKAVVNAPATYNNRAAVFGAEINRIVKSIGNGLVCENGDSYREYVIRSQKKKEALIEVNIKNPKYGGSTVFALDGSEESKAAFDRLVYRL